VKHFRYQLVLLGQERDAWRDALLAEVTAMFQSVGLDFGVNGELLEGAGNAPAWDGFPVAVWCGGAASANPDEVKLVDEFLTRGFGVYPVVAALDNYKLHTPANLHPINGQIAEMKRVGADVMRGFRLARRYRQAFISYRRSESSGVANQLFHEMSERGYRVFLDTVSVEAGADFQKALWSRMADVDLLILLDSPTALDSRWVHEELNRAHDLGMGVLQLIWPRHKRTAGTELSTPLPLENSDFEGGTSLPENPLKVETLGRILNAVESERIRSLNARRTRLVEGLLSNVDGKGVTLLVHPTRIVDVMKGAIKLAEVVTFVGVPDALSVYQHELDKSHEQTFVVYNGLGVDEQWAKHLKWLNEKATVEVFQIDDFGDYIGRLA
jgi:hypothetical protein